MMHLAAIGSSSSLSSSRQAIFSHVFVPCVAAFSTVSLLRNPHRNSLNFFCCPGSLNPRRAFSSLSTHKVSLDDGFRTQGISQFEEEKDDEDEDEDEDARLSRTHADWKAARVYHVNGVIYQGKVEASNAGGLLVRFFSLLGFLPFPLLSPSHTCKEPDKSIQEVAKGLIGSFVSVKVVSAEEEDKKLIFSEKEATWSKFSKFVKVGDVYQARVGSIEDYGAFVHLRFPDGSYHLTGLLHISEVSWDIVHDVRRVLNVGDEVKVKVVSLDRENLKMCLSMKQLLEDPLLETLEKVIPQDGSAGSSVDGNTDYVIEPLPGLETIITELLNEDGIIDIKITRQGFEKRVVSQDLQLWLSNAPSSEQFTLLARAGRQVQEVQLTTLLDQDGIKSALQRVLERIP